MHEDTEINNYSRRIFQNSSYWEYDAHRIPSELGFCYDRFQTHINTHFEPKKASVMRNSNLVKEDADRLHPIQNAFAGKGSYRCGYSSLALVISWMNYLNDGHFESLKEFKKIMSHTNFMVGEYYGIVESIQKQKV